MDNIILIGMPGVGKSTLGVLLAKTLGMTFLDTDLVIQEQEGALLRDLIADRGIEGFLDLEGEVCAHLQAHRTVVATGGSVVYRSQAMAHLRELGTVVYLKLGYRALAKRLGSLKRRGWSSAPARPCGCSMRSGCPSTSSTLTSPSTAAARMWSTPWTG